MNEVISVGARLSPVVCRHQFQKSNQHKKHSSHKDVRIIIAHNVIMVQCDYLLYTSAASPEPQQLNVETKTVTLKQKREYTNESDKSKNAKKSPWCKSKSTSHQKYWLLFCCQLNFGTFYSILNFRRGLQM